MKIAHVVCVFPPYRGGIGKSALDFSLMMAESGHSVDVLTPVRTNVRTSSAESTPKNIKVLRIDPFVRIGNGAFLPGLLFKLKKYDLVYLHYPFFGGAEPVWLFKYFNRKTKLIVHYHMDVLGLPFWLKGLSIPSYLLEKSLLKRADLVTAASLDYVANSKIARFYKENKSKFRETFFPVDALRFSPPKKKTARSKKEILFVGGLDKAHYFKGLEVLLESLSALSNRADWVLKIVGRGDLEDFYKKKCRTLGMENRVLFLGGVSDDNLADIYRQSDFFVLPSVNKGEAFGIVLLEAMASGLPLLASNLAGVRSVFQEGRQGLLLKPGSREDLSQKIIKMLESPQMLAEMSLASRNLALEKYSRDKIKARLDDIVKEL